MFNHNTKSAHYTNANIDINININDVRLNSSLYLFSLCLGQEALS